MWKFFSDSSTNSQYINSRTCNTTSQDKVKENKQFGNLSEDFVTEFLIKNGFTIEARNYCQKFGEIDIIAKKKDTITFVEVKSRKTNYFHLSQVITKSKQKKIILTAKYYVLQNKLYNKILRFDIALLHKIENNFELEYIENAFNETD